MKAIYTILLAALSGTVFSQAPMIYGIASKLSPSETFLGQINTANGVVSNVSPATLGPNYMALIGTIDPINNLYYYENSSNQFIGVDLTSGMPVTNPAMSNPGASFFDLAHYNCKDSTIYGLARALGPTRLYLARINPATGAVTNISPGTVGSGFVSTPSTIDPMTKKFYFEDGSFNFIALDLVTGAITSSPTITNPSPNANLFDSFVYNCEDSTIYGLARKNSTSTMYLAKINPATGVVTNISASSINPNGQTAGGATIDAVNKIFYFQDGNQNLLGLSLLTGNIVSNSPVTNANANSYTNFRCKSLCNCAGITTGIKDQKITAGIKVYPNPFKNSMRVQMHSVSQQVQVKLTDISGKVAFDKSFNAIDHCELETEKIPAGVYFLEVNADGNTWKEKVIKE
jgi:hypothetical protein